MIKFKENRTQVTEITINQRLKILVESLKMNIRSFSKAYNVHEGNLRNYIDRGSKPPAEFISVLMQSIDNINPRWILLGEGEMFLPQVAEPGVLYQKNSGGNQVGHNAGGSVTQLHNVGNTGQAPIGDCEQKLEAALKENELLRAQVVDKEHIIQLYKRMSPPST